MALKDNLVSLWECAEASGNLLDAHSTNDLTETSGTIASTTGLFNTARLFADGDSEYATRADNAALSVGDIDFMVAFWAKFTAVSKNQWIVGQYDTNAQRAWAAQIRSTNVLRLSVSPDGGSGVTAHDTAGTYAATTWYHVVMYHDAVNNLLGIKVNNGAWETTAYSSGVFDSSGNFTVGTFMSSGAAGGQYFDGAIQQIAFWKAIKSDADITTIYNAGSGLAFSSWDAGGGPVVPALDQGMLTGGLGTLWGGLG